MPVISDLPPPKKQYASTLTIKELLPTGAAEDGFAAKDLLTKNVDSLPPPPNFASLKRISSKKKVSSQKRVSRKSKTVVKNELPLTLGLGLVALVGFAVTLPNLLSSQSVLLLQIVQYVPLVLRVYKNQNTGSIQKWVPFLNFSFHALSALANEESSDKLINLALAAQQVYIMSVILRSSSDNVKSEYLFSGAGLAFFAGATLILGKTPFVGSISMRLLSLAMVSLQAGRFIPQLVQNENSKDFKVQSVESHFLAMIPALTLMTFGLASLDVGALFINAFAAVGNAMVAYQLISQRLASP